MDGIQPAASSETPKVAFVDGQFINQADQPEATQIAQAGAEIAAANPFGVPEASALTAEKVSQPVAADTELMDDFIAQANKQNVSLTDLPASEPTIGEQEEVPAVEAPEVPDPIQFSPAPSQAPEVEVPEEPQQVVPEQPADPEPAFEPEAEVSQPEEEVESTDSLEAEINDGFATLIQELDSFLTRVEQRKKEIKDVIEAAKADLERVTAETEAKIKQKNTELSDLKRKEEYARIQREKIVSIKESPERKES